MVPSSSLAATPPNLDSADRILRAAETLFAKHGFGAVSMSTIARRAGVSKANVFHHFATKQALYLAVLTAACRESRGLLEDIVQRSGDSAQHLREFLAGHFAALQEHGCMSRLFLRELLENATGRSQELASQAVSEDFARLADIVRGGQACGELRSDVDPAMVATLLVAANVFLFQAAPLLRHLPGVEFAGDTQGFGDMLMDIVLRGIAARPGTTDAH